MSEKGRENGEERRKKRKEEKGKGNREKPKWFETDQKLSGGFGRVPNECGRFRKGFGERSGECLTRPNFPTLLSSLQGGPSKGNSPKSFGGACWIFWVEDPLQAPKFSKPMSRFPGAEQVAMALSF